MDKELKEYMSDMGRKGGKASRRIIDPEAQAKMQAGRKKKHFNSTDVLFKPIKCRSK